MESRREMPVIDRLSASAFRVPTESGEADGTWVIGSGSAVGYRVVEVLFGQDTEGVGRTDQITGQLRNYDDASRKKSAV